MSSPDPNHPFWAAVRGEVPAPPCAQLLGWKVLEAQLGSGRVVAEFEARQEFTNPIGNVQGGLLAAMLDDTMGPAVGTTFATNEFCPTLELKVSFLRPTKPGKLIATAWVVHRTKSIAFVQSELRDSDGDLVATGSATARIVRMESGMF